MTSKEFFENLETIASERKLDINDVLEKVKTSITVACRDTKYGRGDIKFDIDFEKKRIRIFEYFYVVDEITEGNKGEILLDEARELKPKIKVGGEIKTEVNLDEFGRKAAGKFKQTFMSGLRELERDEAFKFFNDKVGEIITATVVDNKNDFITFDIGKDCVATMPVKEGVPGEAFEIGDNKKVYITKVERMPKGPKVFLSRSNREIVRRLLEITVPEIANGTIEIMGMSRDAGNRTKVGVLSTNSKVDPKGACVGAGGLRIKSINEALNNEKIDVFRWSSDPVELISSAILPARSLSVVVDEKTKSSVVVVPDDQFSLAIGKNGQNARLAAYATGWKIDIMNYSKAVEEKFKFTYNVYYGR